MNQPLNTWNYSYCLPAGELTKIVSSFVRGMFSGLAGSYKEGSQVVVTFFADQTKIFFNLSSARHLSVHVDLARQKEASKLCSALAKQAHIKPLHEKVTYDRKTEKVFTPAKAVLARHMADPKFSEHILVLPEALAQAEECRFENDGPLDRYLTNLLKYAQARRDPANARKPNDYLAQQAGLTHYADGIGLAAQTKYPEDYTATYQGQTRIFGPHVTIGKGFDPRLCMSIYFDWDPTSQKLLLARFGRHGRGA